MSKKGGYVIVDLKGKTITAGTPFTLDGVTARLDRAKTKACLLSGFAMGAEEKRDVFVDLQKTDDGYIALFGQYTITIEDDNVTITDGGILLENIVDSQGHKRFFDGNIITPTVEGVTVKYAKYSLSGYHLMITMEVDIADETVFPGEGTTIGRIEVPLWIADKLIPIFSKVVTRKIENLYGSDYSIQNANVYLLKQSDNTLTVALFSTTLTADRSARISFDLNID